MNSAGEIISVFIGSSVKFIVGPGLALGYGFTFYKAVAVTTLGGYTGVVFFVFLFDTLIKNVKKLKSKKKVKDPAQPSTKIFTRKNKIIVWVKRRFGLLGIAVLTPSLISIPLGCYLSVRYFKDKQLIIKYMFVSILLWSVAISSFKLFF